MRAEWSGQIVRLAAFQGLFQVLEPGFFHPGIGRIQNSNFIVLDQVRIVGHAFRHNVLAFK